MQHRLILLLCLAATCHNSQLAFAKKVGLYGRYSCEGEYLRGVMPNVQKQSVGSIMLTIRPAVPQMIIDDPHENGVSHSEWELQVLPSGKIPASFKSDPQGKLMVAAYDPEAKKLLVDLSDVSGITLFATCYRFPSYETPATTPAQPAVAPPVAPEGLSHK